MSAERATNVRQEFRLQTRGMGPEGCSMKEGAGRLLWRGSALAPTKPPNTPSEVFTLCKRQTPSVLVRASRSNLLRFREFQREILNSMQITFLTPKRLMKCSHSSCSLRLHTQQDAALCVSPLRGHAAAHPLSPRWLLPAVCRRKQLFLRAANNGSATARVGTPSTPPRKNSGVFSERSQPAKKPCSLFPCVRHG